jgi:uncharacterized protein
VPKLWDSSEVLVQLSANLTRVIAAPAAFALIKKLMVEYGAIIFHQSGGCCDGSSLMCFAVGDYLLSPYDVQLGTVGGANFYMNSSQFEHWKYTQLIVDVVPGIGGMFSLENGSGLRFLTRSRVFREEELSALSAETANSTQISVCGLAGSFARID